MFSTLAPGVPYFGAGKPRTGGACDFRKQLQPWRGETTMAIDEVPVQSGQPAESSTSSGGSKTILVVVALAALAAGELFTVARMNTMREQLTQQQSQLRDDMSGQLRDQLSTKLTAIQR